MHDIRIAIPHDVLVALRDIEQRRLTDMYDREIVLVFAAAFGHDEAAEWLAMHRYLYFRALEQARAGCEVPQMLPALAALAR